MNVPNGNLPGFRAGSFGKELLLPIVATVSLFLSISFVPLAGFFAGVLTPAPVSLAVIRLGFPGAWLVPVFAALGGSLSLHFLGLSGNIPYLLSLIGMGALMGHGFRSKWHTEKIVGLSSLFVIGVAGLFAVLAFTESNGGLVGLMEEDLRQVISATLKQIGGPSAENRELEANLLEYVPLIVRMIPGVLVSCAVLIAWLNLLISRKYCRMVAVEYCVFERLTLWKTPEFLVWFIIAGGILIVLPLGNLRLTGINIVVIMGTLYFLQGLSIVAFFFERWRLPFFIKGFVYAALFLQQFASMVVAALGLFDVWFDFRKMIKKPA
jgi:uncharacterized protein YybS (DUF2232 family)